MALQWSFPQRDKWTQTMLGKYPLQNIPYVGVKFEGFSVNMSKILYLFYPGTVFGALKRESIER